MGDKHGIFWDKREKFGTNMVFFPESLIFYLLSGENLTEVRLIRTNRLNVLSQPISDSLWMNTLMSYGCCCIQTPVTYVLQDDIAIIGSSVHTWPTTLRRIVFRIRPNCRDSTVADVPAFSIPSAWFCSSFFSLGIFFDLFQQNFIEFYRYLEKTVKSDTDTGYDMCRTKHTCQTI